MLKITNISMSNKFYCSIYLFKIKVVQEMAGPLMNWNDCIRNSVTSNLMKNFRNNIWKLFCGYDNTFTACYIST